MNKPDYWALGYQAGLNGRGYEGYPVDANSATAWAFGYGEGSKERNRQSLKAIIDNINKEQSNASVSAIRF